MAAEDPKTACEELLSLIRSSLSKVGVKANNTVNDAVTFAVQAAKNIKAKTPMVHHITNYVVINDNANATLAVGASPIMSTNRQEMEQLAAIP
ncbi:hypothetical protein G6F42_028761 [Rhizopus arrhizus]|nr:hypothetical protein G6F42_028761 [Rhizopus arrhizus]